MIDETSVEKTKNELLKEYFCAVTMDDVITIDKLKRISIDGEPITEGEAASLFEEAKFFKESRLYSIMINTLKKQAMEVMYNQSQSFDDMRNGKMMLYNLSLQENIVKVILNNFAKKK